MRDAILARLEKVKGPNGQGEYRSMCPFHDDHGEGHLYTNFDKGTYYCHKCYSKGPTSRLAMELGITDFTKSERREVAAYDYHDAQGRVLYQAVRYIPKDFRQRRPDGAGGWVWNLEGVKLVLYHLPEVLDAVKKGETVYVTEGEKDADNLRAWELVATTNPMGAGKWKSEYSETLTGANVVILPDDDKDKKVNTGRIHGQEVARSLTGKAKSIKIVELPGEGVKDASDWLQAGGTKEELERLVRETPETAKRSLMDEHESGTKQSEDAVKQSIEELERAAAPVLALDDPLVRLDASIRAVGFGGQTKHVIIPYFAATSRVLAMERGNMPVHTGLHGSTSSGKTYALDTMLAHLPPEVVVKVDAGSPRILIYDKKDLRHKVIVFSEADSIPGIRQRGDDEDFNPAGAAFRALLQDHNLAYDFVDMKAQGGPKVVHVVREGPSVLLTTYTKRLPGQIDSRLFTVDVPEDTAQIRAALAAQGLAEVTGRAGPDGALIAFQALLQARAPWRVVIPFAPRLSELIADRPAAPRIMRDFQRILSLIKSVAVIRHQRRLVDGRGYLVAQVEDYQTVCDLIGEMYETTAGVSADVRGAVEAVRELEAAGQKSITATKVGQKLGIGKPAAARRLGVALKEGWVVNNNTPVKGRPWDLQVGEPMPDRMTLPTPDLLPSVSGCFDSVSLESSEQTSTECLSVSTVFRSSVADAVEVSGKGERL